MNIENVKSTMASQGWAEIEDYLRAKLADIRLAKNISKNKSFQDIAIDTLAKGKAARLVERTLTELKQMTGPAPEPTKPFI